MPIGARTSSLGAQSKTQGTPIFLREEALVPRPAPPPLPPTTPPPGAVSRDATRPKQTLVQSLLRVRGLRCPDEDVPPVVLSTGPALVSATLCALGATSKSEESSEKRSRDKAQFLSEVPRNYKSPVGKDWNLIHGSASEDEEEPSDTGAQSSASKEPKKKKSGVRRWNKGKSLALAPNAAPSSFAYVVAIQDGDRDAILAAQVNADRLERMAAERVQEGDPEPLSNRLALVLIWLGPSQSASFRQFMDSLAGAMTLNLIKAYVLDKPAVSTNLPLHANTALRTGANHGYDVLSLMGPTDLIPCGDPVEAFSRELEDCGSPLLCVFDEKGSWHGGLTTWAWAWEKVGFLEQRYQSRMTMSDFVNLIHSDYDVEIVSTNKRESIGTPSELPKQMEWETNFRDRQIHQNSMVNNESLPYVGQPVRRVFAAGAIADHPTLGVGSFLGRVYGLGGVDLT